MTVRRVKGEGGLYQRASDGRWIAVVDLGIIDGRRVRKYVTGKTRTEALQKLRRARGAIAAGLPVPDDRMTFGAYLDGWMATIVPEAVASVNTLDNYAWAVEGHIKPALGHKRLTQLTPRDIADFLLAKRDAKLARNSVSRLRTVLIAALGHAVLEGLVTRNVAALVRTPKGDRPEGRSLDVDQAKALLAVCKGERLEALFVTMLMLGLRPGEALGLTWDNIDFEAQTLRIDKSLKRERNALRLGETKTRRSKRALKVPAPVLKALQDHRRRQAKEQLAAGEGGWENPDLVFASAAGSLIDPSNLRRDFSRLTKAAGLGHWHPHELRHSAASLLSASGVPIEVIADVLGHTTTRMLERVYRHPVTPTVDAAAKPMEDLFGQ